MFSSSLITIHHETVHICYVSLVTLSIVALLSLAGGL